MNEINFNIRFFVPLSTVWTAITDPIQMKNWYFDIDDMILEEGETFSFYESEKRKYLHQCKILELEKEKIFKHTWRFPDYSDRDSVVTWRLEEEDGGSRLYFSHEEVSDFYVIGPDFSEQNFRNGWDYLIKYALKNNLYGIETLTFHQRVNVKPELVWEYMWDQDGYSEWTSVFTEGSQYQGVIQEGQRIHLLDGKGGGMYSDIDAYKDNDHLIFKHIGSLKEGKEMPIDEGSRWTGSLEKYFIKPHSNGCEIIVEVDTDPEYIDWMNKAFPKALEAIKRIAEATIR